MLDADWRENVIIDAPDAEMRQNILNMHAEFQEVSNEDLGHTDVHNHCIELTALHVSSISSVPYHTGPKAHKLQKAEIVKMVYMNFVQPVQSK